VGVVMWGVGGVWLGGWGFFGWLCFGWRVCLVGEVVGLGGCRGDWVHGWGCLWWAVGGLVWLERCGVSGGLVVLVGVYAGFLRFVAGWWGFGLVVRCVFGGLVFFWLVGCGQVAGGLGWVGRVLAWVLEAWGGWVGVGWGGLGGVFGVGRFVGWDGVLGDALLLGRGLCSGWNVVVCFFLTCGRGFDGGWLGCCGRVLGLGVSGGCGVVEGFCGGVVDVGGGVVVCFGGGVVLVLCVLCGAGEVAGGGGWSG